MSFSRKWKWVAELLTRHAGALLIRAGFAALLAFGLAGCGEDAAPGEVPIATTAPTTEMLRGALQAELSRLGIDPGKDIAAVPKGQDNAVFDLKAQVLDPDGEGPLPPTGIELTWTERALGDYDQNGEVNVADLQPLGLNWNETVDYDDPALHGGFAEWPSGDPEDDGGNTPPAPTSGAYNWRLARVDGDGNGELSISDVTPIALHWRERLSGYRVYRRGPDEVSFTKLADPGDPASPLTVPRPTLEALRPVRYDFTDQPPELGTYEYYVQAYALNEGQAETQSNQVAVVLSAGFADTTPPKWTEVYIEDGGYGTQWEHVAEGLRDVRVGNGKLIITCADAVDVLSPPVHYDLYYVSDRVADSVFTTYGGHELRSDVEVIRDIPKVYELAWENRHRVHLLVRARDSAVPPNEDDNNRAFATAPTDLPRIRLHHVLPGIDPAHGGSIDSLGVFHREQRVKYICYHQRPTGGVAPEVWVAALDLTAGHWTAQLVETYEVGVDHVRLSEFALSPMGKLWAHVEVSQGAGACYEAFYQGAPGGGWARWDPLHLSGFWKGSFDHNGHPVFYALSDSTVNPETQRRLIYRWWDEGPAQWREEKVCDPGGLAVNTLRPDGVIQLVVKRDFVDPLADEAPPVYGHVHERTADGTWTEVHRSPGGLYPSFSPRSPAPYWGEAWAWTAAATDSTGELSGLLTFGEDGYALRDPLPSDEGGPHAGSWPADGGAHGPPHSLWRDGCQVTYSYSHPELVFPGSWLVRGNIQVPLDFAEGGGCDAVSGWVGWLYPSTDPETGKRGVWLVGTPPGTSLYDPLEW